MMQIIYGPWWFNGKDILIDVISMFVLLLISSFSVRSYKISKNKNYLYLAISFAMLGVSFIFKNLLNLGVYYKILQTNQMGFAVLTYQSIQNLETLFMAGILLYRILSLFGFYILYATYEKQSKLNILLTSYLLIILVYFSQSNFLVFHITALVLLAMTIYQYLCKCKTVGTGRKLLASSFGVIALSQVCFILSFLGNSFYVAAEIMQMIGYIILLIVFIGVVWYGKKNKN